MSEAEVIVAPVSTAELAEDLDDMQRRAVEHGADPLVVATGAGTGKTRVLTSRVARLIDAGVAPERILLLTFTRRAAAAMTARAAAMVGDTALAQRIAGGTFHAVAHRVVAEYSQHLGLADVTVLAPDDIIDLIDLLRSEHGLDGTDRRMPTSRAIADIASRAVSLERPGREVISEQFPWALDHADQIMALLRAYAQRKRARGLLDLDDLLIAWRSLVRDPDVGARLRARWDWVLVDEYQDVNRVQADIVHGLRPDGRGLTVVGDDAQAIYGFRGAGAGQLQEVLDRLPHAELIRLERNFRSTQPILDLANAARPEDFPIRLVADRTGAAARPELVTCENADDEARTVADRILAAHADGLPLREQAVLMRTGSHSALLEVELKVRNVPFMKFGGIGYLETAHVRDLLAAFRVVLNPADEIAWYRLLTRHRGLGKVSSRRLAGVLADQGIAGGPEAIAAAPATARVGLATTLSLLGVVDAGSPVAELVEACHDAVLALLGQHYPDWQRRAADVTAVAEAAGRQTDLRAFVSDQAIDPIAVAGDWASSPHLDEDWVTLSTIHSAKGLEWSAVHLLRATDGAIPSDMALTSRAGLEEERRLFYVGLTRARDTLSVYAPATLPTHPTAFTARHVQAKPSRFLTSSARSCLTVVDTRVTTSGPSAAPPGPRVRMDDLDALFA